MFIFNAKSMLLSVSLLSISLVGPVYASGRSGKMPQDDEENQRTLTSKKTQKKQSNNNDQTQKPKKSPSNK